MSANVKWVVEQKSQTSAKPILPIGWQWFTILFAVLTYHLISKLPTQTHQLHYLEPRTSFSDTITSKKHETCQEMFVANAYLSGDVIMRVWVCYRTIREGL